MTTVSLLCCYVFISGIKTHNCYYYSTIDEEALFKNEHYYRFLLKRIKKIPNLHNFRLTVLLRKKRCHNVRNKTETFERNIAVKQPENLLCYGDNASK